MSTTTFSQRLTRLVFGDHRRSGQRLHDNGFADEAEAVAWANTILGPDTDNLSDVAKIKRLRDAKPGLDLGTATYIANRRNARPA